MTEPGRVEGVALVTGGTGALGTAVVAELLDAGAEVVTTWLLERERGAALAAFGDRDAFTLVEANLLEGGAERAVEVAVDVGPLTAVVNLVGGFAGGPRLHEADPAELEKLLALNLTSAVNCCRAALPELIDDGGSIVCVGARPAIAPFKGSSAYTISKAAVLALVRSLHVEYRDDGVRANAILPSVIDTPRNREEEPDADYDKWVPPAEIGRVIRFLCSPDSAPISGVEIPVYGRA